MLAYSSIKRSVSKITIPHNIIEENDELTIQKIGGKSFWLFSVILLFIHHLTLFILEHTSFDFFILLKGSSTLITDRISVIILFFYKV